MAEGSQSLTPFIGREVEVETLTRLVRATRLVTLTGAGGSGKTRLAGAVAQVVASGFDHGAAWVELAPLSEPELLPTYLLDAMAIEPGARSSLNALVETLRERHMILVLDNCEHLVEVTARTVETLLRACPKLHILATSREALGVSGERAWLVPGLAVPEAGEKVPEHIGSSPAVQLFVDRAQAALASFKLTSANANAVAQICRRLDGLPLAIELAAARVRTLPPEQLAPRLDDGFRALGTGARTAVPRHRTLRAAVEWSYQLLDGRESTLLQRLSIFAGDFTLQAAESVGADADLDAADVLDTLGALVDKSMVVMREAEGTARYYLLETIRQYAAGRLKESGAFHHVCQRHAHTYMELVAQAAPHLIARERPTWVQRIHREMDNIRAALACTREDDAAAHLRMCADLGWFWYSSGLWSEGRRWQESAIALPWTIEMQHERARVLFGGSVLASLQGEPATAIPWLEESAGLFHAVRDASGEAYALAYLGVSWGQKGDGRTVEPTTRALACFRESGDLYGLRLCLVVLATYYGVTGDGARARALGEEAVTVARSFGLDRELAIALQVLAAAHLADGGDTGRAATLVHESVGALQRDPSLFWSARALQLLAIVHFRSGHAERGAHLMGVAEVVREMIGAGMLGPDRAHLEPALTAARTAIGDLAFNAAWNKGRAQSLSSAFEEIVAESRIDPRPSTAVEPIATPLRAPLDVRALGALQLFRDGTPLPSDAWRYARPRELLLFLLSHAQGRTRDQIGIVFWPDASSTQVKNNFHVMLHHVRKTIGRADLVVFDDERYRMAWELGIRFDARTFEEELPPRLRALRAARSNSDVARAIDAVRETLGWYRGDFLCDERVGDWHLEIRDRLRRFFGEAQLYVGQRCAEVSQFDQAADAFRAAIRVDELHEESHRQLMRVLVRAGNRSEAVRQYERLTRTLRTELEAAPERETTLLHERIRKGEPL
jgi:predicted ATPase/DNA-binding SARP family transcriptional activator